MGFDQGDRMALFRLLLTDEKKLDSLTIEDWFKETPHIFETSFWYMWQTAFAFKRGAACLNSEPCEEDAAGVWPY